MLLVSAVAIFFFIPNVKVKTDDPNAPIKKRMTLSVLWRKPSILLPLVDRIVNSFGMGLNHFMLTPHMVNGAGATQTQIGITYTIHGIASMCASPLLGYVSHFDCIGIVDLYVPNVVDSRGVDGQSRVELGSCQILPWQSRV